MKYIINKFKIVSFMGGLFYTLVTIGLSLLSIFILGLIARFCITELGLHTMEDFFSALCAVMFVGGIVTADLILVYIWLIVYIFEKG